MGLLRKSVQLEIAGHKITVESGDAERVKARTWRTIKGDSDVTKFYHNVSNNPAQPVYEFLEHFILEAPNSRFVGLIKRDLVNQFNFRRSNLQMR
jgi:hypothetical protein